MCDDLIKELDIALNYEKVVNPSKLQTYFDSNDNDDIFSALISDNASSSNFFESKRIDEKYENILGVDAKIKEDIIKNVRFSDSFDSEFENPLKEKRNLNLISIIGSGWLTSESTKSILLKNTFKELNINQVNETLLARPQLHTDPGLRLSDPIFSLLVENYNINTATELRQIPQIENYQETGDSVILLIKRGWIRPAIDLTSKILYNMGFTYAKSELIDSTSSSFSGECGNIWCLRFALLVRMKLFTILESEISGFHNLDCPNLYYEFYNDSSNNSKGSIIPFSMRLIYAELPCYFNKFSEALNRLYYLLAVIKRILINLKSGYSEDGTKFVIDECSKMVAIELWNKREIRVRLSILRVLIASKDYPSAIDVVYEIISKSINISNHTLADLLYFLLSRIYLHVGDIDSSEFCFDESIKLVKESDSLQENEKEEIIKSKLFLKNGFINMSRGNFEDSRKCFQEYLEIYPISIMALNNYAVCCLYLKKVEEAISVFEKLIHKGIRHDAFILNLCILYELQTTQVKNKKLKIVKLLSKIDGDDFNITSFKLTNTD